MNDQQLRERLIELLEGGLAHARVDDAVSGFPPDLRHRVVRGSGYSPWQLLEHMRITQWDILMFCSRPDHQSPAWPEDYWPAEEAPPEPEAWDRSLEQFLHDLESIKTLVADPARDLFAPFPHGQGQNLLREALLAADHNAYHLGQMVQLRKQLGIWPE